MAGKLVFLTFDDGPNEPYSSQILDILNQFDVQATFFVCGENVNYYPQVARRIVGDGHQIGNHTFSHPRFLSLAGLLRKEIERTEKIIFEITGKKTTIFRPPWGYLSPWLKNFLKRRGYKVFLWNLSVKDWKKSSPEKISQKVLNKIGPNQIILLHDGDRVFHNHDRSWTVKALPLIIKGLKNKGFNFSTDLEASTYFDFA